MAKNSFRSVINATKAQVRTHKKLFIIIIILNFVGAIFAGNAYDIDYSISPIFGVFLYMASTFCGFILSVNLFKDMHSKQYADVMLSMPLTAVQRFFSKLLTIVFVQIIPTLISFILMGVCAYISLPTLEEMQREIMLYGHDESYYSVMGVNLMDGVLLGTVKSVLLLLLIALCAILFTNAVAIFTSCCCGSQIESFMFSILNIGCFSALHYVIYDNLIFKFSNIDTNFTDAIWGYGSVISDSTVLQIISCLISIAIIFLALPIYKKRDAVSIGKPIVFRWFFNFEMLLGIIVCLLVFMSAYIFITGVIITFIGFIIMQIILVRGKVKVKNVLKWFGGYIGTLTILVGILFASYYTNGFGYNPEMANSNLKIYSVDLNFYGHNDYTTLDTNFDNGEMYIYGEQAEKVKDILFKYKDKKEKSFSEFFKITSYSFFDSYYDGFGPEVCCNISMMEDGFEYRYYYIRFSLSKSDREKLYAELKELGFLHENKYEDIYDDEGIEE